MLTDEPLSRHCLCPRAATYRGTQAASLSQSRVILDPSLKGHPSSQTLPETGPQPHFPQSRARMKSVGEKEDLMSECIPLGSPCPRWGQWSHSRRVPAEPSLRVGGGREGTQDSDPQRSPPPSLSHAHYLRLHVLTCKMEGH